jgi:hypothetical protein
LSALPPARVTIRILRPPPTRRLEGIDLRPYFFEPGDICDVDGAVADLLVAWSYAERLHGTAARRTSKAARHAGPGSTGIVPNE